MAYCVLDEKKKGMNKNKKVLLTRYAFITTGNFTSSSNLIWRIESKYNWQLHQNLSFNQIECSTYIVSFKNEEDQHKFNNSWNITAA